MTNKDSQNKSGLTSPFIPPLSNAAALGVFALLTMSLVFAFYVLTLEPIARGKAEYERQILLVLGSSFGKEDELQFSGKGSPTAGYDILKNGVPVGTILPARTDAGYSGNIEMLAAVANNGSLVSLRVTAHSETPGLGDKIDREKSDWVLQFNDRTADTVWQLKQNGGDFDSLTGATITSRAVVNAAASVVKNVK